MCGPQIRLSLFTFRPIALKQLNGLTTIYTISLRFDADVTHPSGVEKSRVQFSTLTRNLMFDFLFCCCCVFTFLTNTHYLSRYFLTFFLNRYITEGYQDTDQASLKRKYNTWIQIKQSKNYKYSFSKMLCAVYLCFCVVLSVCFCMGHFDKVSINFNLSTLSATFLLWAFFNLYYWSNAKANDLNVLGVNFYNYCIWTMFTYRCKV